MNVAITYTEDTLVAALRNHDNDAYKHLYVHYRGALYSIITQFINDTEIANDVLQDVFVAVWKNIDHEKVSVVQWGLSLSQGA